MRRPTPWPHSDLILPRRCWQQASEVSAVSGADGYHLIDCYYKFSNVPGGHYCAAVTTIPDTRLGYEYMGNGQCIDRSQQILPYYQTTMGGPHGVSHAGQCGERVRGAR